MTRFYRGETRRIEVIEILSYGVRVRIVEEKAQPSADLLGYEWVLPFAELASSYNEDSPVLIRPDKLAGGT
jgi:hypothetical protein